jgi:putative flippase GtrA
MLKHFFSWQFIGFIGSGLVAATLNWLARFVLSNWFPFYVSVFLAYAVGMVVAFIFNSLLVFPNSKKPRKTQARRFILINLSFLPVVWITSLSLAYTFDSIGIKTFTEEIAHGIAIAIPAFFTFFLYKFFAFKES